MTTPVEEVLQEFQFLEMQYFVDKGSMKVRKPNVKGIMMAKRAQVNLVSAEAPASTVAIVSQTPPPQNLLERNSKALLPLKRLQDY